MPSFVDNYEMLSFFRYILDVECFPIFEMNSCMFIVWNCKDGLASGRCLRRATPVLHDAREG